MTSRRVVLGAEREQDVLGRGDRAAVAQVTGLMTGRFKYALGPR
jgi:hypothetical protein